jgi:hypothetical protein
MNQEIHHKNQIAYTSHKKISAREPHGRALTAPGGGCRAGEPAARLRLAADHGRLPVARRGPHAGGSLVGGHERRAGERGRQGGPPAEVHVRRRRGDGRAWCPTDGGGGCGGTTAAGWGEWGWGLGFGVYIYVGFMGRLG